MGFSSSIRNGVALANKLTKDLQVVVSFYAWIGTDDTGGPRYADPISVLAVVEDKHRTRRFSNGQEVVQKAVITILVPMNSNGASGRSEPIDPRDKFVLPNGTTGPILDVSGIVDPITNRPYMHEVVLGWSLV